MTVKGTEGATFYESDSSKERNGSTTETDLRDAGLIKALKKATWISSLPSSSSGKRQMQGAAPPGIGIPREGGTGFSGSLDYLLRDPMASLRVSPKEEGGRDPPASLLIPPKGKRGPGPLGFALGPTTSTLGSLGLASGNPTSCVAIHLWPFW